MAASPVLEAKNLSFKYSSKWAVKELNFTLQPGITGLLGPNGAGKTTLMRLAIGLLSPSNGVINLFGGDPAQSPELRLKAGYLPQEFSPPNNTRVVDYLEYLAMLSGVPGRSVRRTVHAALSQVGLGDRLHSKFGALSGGMVRRVGIAQATMHNPELLIADEPTAGLDPEERQQLFDNFREIAHERPALLSSHQVDEIEREAENVWFLQHGRLAWSGSVADAVNSMKNRVRQGELPKSATPQGQIVSRKSSPSGHLWRVIGNEPRLSIAQATLLDAYFEHTSPLTEP